MKTTLIRKIVGVVLVCACTGAVWGDDLATTEVPVSLPTGYTPLEWIRSTGAEYIDTAVNGDVGLEAELDMAYHGSGRDEVMLGCRDTANGRFYLLARGTTNKCGYGYDVNYEYKREFAYTVDRRTLFRVVLHSDFRGLYVDGSETPVENAWSEEEREFSTGASLFLFANNAGNGYGSNALATLYRAKIFRGGVLLRDFVPCRRRLDGAAGAFDLVSAAFFPNLGGGRFLGSDGAETGEGNLDFIQASGSQYIDTGIVGKCGMETELDVALGGIAKNKPDQVMIGCSNGGRFYPVAQCQGNKLGFGYGTAGEYLRTFTYTADQRYHFRTVMREDFRALYINGNETPTITSTTLHTFNSGINMYLFGLNNGTATVAAPVVGKLWHCTIRTGVTAAEPGELVRDYRPWRNAEGEVGLLDWVSGQFFSNQGSGTFTASDIAEGAGLRYRFTGTTLQIKEGALTDAAFLQNYATLEKVGPLTASVATLATLPPTTVTAGTLSFADDLATTHTVAGTLTLTGAANLQFDVTATGADKIVASAVVLDGVTEQTPVLLRISAVGISSLDAPRELIVGGGFTSADLSRFTLDAPIPVQLAVADGKLMLERRAVGAVTWAGAGSTTAWSEAANWQNGTLPETGATVNFNLPAGGTTDGDIENLHLPVVNFDANAGAFTHGGLKTLDITKAITNLSTAAQTFTLPLSLGSAGEPFEVMSLGSVALTGSSVALAGTGLVKRGAGTLLINDKTVADTAQVCIEEGSLAINHTALVTAAAAEGEIHISPGARLDVNVDHGGQGSLVKTEAVHGKTIYVVGNGPDGQGALINSNPAQSWGASFGHVVLTGDASIGGPGHISVRTLSGSRCPNPVIEGPYTLTVTNDLTYAENTTGIPNLQGCAFALDRLDLYGTLQLESTHSGVITNGLHCHSGSYLRLYSASLPVGLAVVADDGVVTLGAASNTGTVNGAVVVRDGVSLALDAQMPLNLNCVTNLGSLANVSTGIVSFTGELAGNGTITGGNIRFSGTNTRWTMVADGTGFTSKMNVEGVTDANFLAGLARLDITYTGDMETVHVFDVCPAFGLTTEKARFELRVQNAAGEVIPNCWLGVTAGRLVVHIADATMIRTAEWRGNAESAVDDPTCWICSNDVAQVEGALPREMTTVSLPDGCVFNCPSGAAFCCRRLITPASIGGSCDWRGIDLEVRGTLDIGTNTLVVSSLGGDGTITGGAYEWLEYVQSSKTQYVDTGVVGATGLEAEFDVAILSTASDVLQLGCNNGSRFYFLATGYGSKAGFGIGSNNSEYVRDWPFTVGQRYQLRIVMHADERALYVDGAETPLLRRTTNIALSTGINLYLFAMNNRGSANNFSDDRVYRLKLFQNGELLRDFVPARRRRDGAVGFVDLAHGDPSHDEFYASDNGNALVAGPITSGGFDFTTGELHVDVPAGTTLVNSSVALTGGLKLVKDGEGTFVANKFEQTYGGGTRVVAGTVTLPLSGEKSNTYTFANHQYGLAGNRFVVETGATFDTKGNYDLSTYEVVLNGGSLANTGCKQANYASGWVCGGNVTLTSNSFYRIDYSISHTAGEIDLGGNVLEAQIASGAYLLLDKTLTNGTLRTLGPGMLQFRTTAVKDMRSVDLDLGTAITLFDVDINVRNLTTFDYTGTFGSGGKGVNVYGTYKPINDYVYNFTLQDGVTIDLSARNTPFDITDKTLAFATDATIFVEMRDRRASNGAPVIAWDEASPPANLDSLTFTAVPGAKYYVCTREDGVYVMGGLAIYLR